MSRAVLKSVPPGSAVPPDWRRRVSVARIVMKFGGTSVATVERIRQAARHVKREVDAGNEVSVVVSAPTGQYDPARAVNVGTNRWAVKPEVGLSHHFKGRFILDAYVGLWLYQDNQKFFGGRVRSQAPIVSSQYHISYDIKPRMWAAFDANFYSGGRTTVNGILSNDFQRNSRVGGTFSFPVTRRQSMKLAYAVGAYTTVGGAFQTFSIGYNYLWGAGL